MLATVSRVKARKDYPEFGITKGQEHFTWTTFRTFRSVEFPRNSQRETIETLKPVWKVYEEFESLKMIFPDVREDIVSILETAIEELESSFDNLPEGFQQGPRGEMYQEYIDQLSGFMDVMTQFEYIEWEEVENDDLEDSPENTPEGWPDHQASLAWELFMDEFPF